MAGSLSKVKRARFVFLFLFLFTVGQVAGFLIILIYFLHTSNKNVSRLNYFRKDEKLYFSPKVLGTLRLATTDYRRLDGRLLGLGRDKGFSPEPPSWL